MVTAYVTGYIVYSLILIIMNTQRGGMDLSGTVLVLGSSLVWPALLAFSVFMALFNAGLEEAQDAEDED